MTFAGDDYVVCDGCGEIKGVPSQYERAVEFLRAANWHHGEGLTIGGKPYASDMCPNCAKPGTSRKKASKPLTQQYLWED